MKVVVTGSRHQHDMAFIWTELDRIHAQTPITRLAHGNCRGTDWICKNWADNRGVLAVAYEAKWNQFGPAAGPIRNEEMLSLEQPTLVLAFDGGVGTKSCVKLARQRGLAVRHIPGGDISIRPPTNRPFLNR